ncbi:MAG: hypothetical protein G3M78_13375 [Candidatus Nitrohelix vancouverensis]|uniref:Glycosyl transferase family 28 C-terminal domain-containing protein n=1 Tax=Candidatus Nitrohelix vancouverensis TaxID=2705534 RepID=A0A7T0G4E4_9BACT|nr:MAG: hypothetical protein G3M78_13375 [Candidatus Nitrohelix vancouverensis]
MKLAICLDAGDIRGMGHCYRQLRLARCLQSKGYSIDFFLPDYAPAIELLHEAGFVSRPCEPNDILPTANTRYDAAIVDLLDTKPEYIRQLKQRARKIVVFEDLGDGRNHADLLIDANLSEQSSAPVPSSVQTLFGLKHLVLAPEFASPLAPPASDNEGKYLIAIGGVDHQNLTQTFVEILQTVASKPGGTVIVGPGYAHLEKLSRICSKGKYRLLNKVSNMADIMRQHAITFCAGGITMHEAMAAGSVPFVTSVAPHQILKAQHAETTQTGIFLGTVEQINAPLVASALQNNQERIEAMRERGRRMVDGRGMERVVSAIQKLLS